MVGISLLTLLGQITIGLWCKSVHQRSGKKKGGVDGAAIQVETGHQTTTIVTYLDAVLKAVELH